MRNISLGYALSSPLNQELRLPSYFDNAVKIVTSDQVSKDIITQPDIDLYMQKIQQAINAGFDSIYFHQAGPNQEIFFKFVENELLPRFEKKYKPKK